MNDKLQLMVEAERRGILPESKRAALAEARRRGLVPLAPGIPEELPEQPADIPKAKVDQWGMIGRDLTNLGRGAVAGAESTALGVVQMASRAPQMGLADAAAEMLGLPSPMAEARGYIDSLAASRADEFSSSEVGKSPAGKLGSFLGGAVATAPIGYLSIPAKGAGILNATSRSAMGGALAAGMQPVPGGDEFDQQKLEQAGLGGLLGGGFTLAARGAMAGAERLGYTPNVMAQLANAGNKRANANPLAQEGEELAQRTGVRLTPGQVSGSRIQTALENMSKQSVFSADKAAEAERKIAGDVIGFINRLMDKITREPVSAASVGARIQNAATNAVKSITDRRRAVTAPMYEAIDKALDGRAFVDYGKTRNTVDGLITDYEAAGTPSADAIASQLRKLREKLNEPQTLKQFQMRREFYGKASQGQGSIFDNLDRTANQRVARRLYAALSDDLDESAARLDGAGPGLVPAGYLGLSEALKRANGEYRRYTQLAGAVKDHPIARLFGKDVRVDGEDWFNTLPPETVIDRVRKMAPEQIGMVRRYMEGADPDAWQQYKRLLVQDALEKAQTLPASMGKSHVPFNAATFLRELGGSKPAEIAKLRQAFSADELKDIDDAFNVARRLGDKFGANFSGTGPYNEVMSMFDSLKKRSVEALASTAGEAFGLRKFANVMLDADGRRALVELSRLPPRSKQAAALLSQLAALASGQQALDPNDQQRQ